MLCFAIRTCSFILVVGSARIYNPESLLWASDAEQEFRSRMTYYVGTNEMVESWLENEIDAPKAVKNEFMEADGYGIQLRCVILCLNNI